MAWFQPLNIEIERRHAKNAMLAENWWVVALRGVLAILFGIAAFGAVVLTWWLGAYGLIFGCTLLVLAFRLRRHRGEHVPAGMATSV